MYCKVVWCETKERATQVALGPFGGLPRATWIESHHYQPSLTYFFTVRVDTITIITEISSDLKKVVDLGGF